jgi:hypothetical protein
MSKTYLKIKLMSLAAEAKIIRRQEQKLVKRRRQLRAAGKEVPETSDVLVSLHNHRTLDVRSEARSAHLAYGYLRGTPYRAMEWRCEDYHQPKWKRVLEIVNKFGSMKHTAEALAEWADVPAEERRAA